MPWVEILPYIGRSYPANGIIYAASMNWIWLRFSPSYRALPMPKARPERSKKIVWRTQHQPHTCLIKKSMLSALKGCRAEISADLC